MPQSMDMEKLAGAIDFFFLLGNELDSCKPPLAKLSATSVKVKTNAKDILRLARDIFEMRFATRVVGSRLACVPHTWFVDLPPMQAIVPDRVLFLPVEYGCGRWCLKL